MRVYICNFARNIVASVSLQSNKNSLKEGLNLLATIENDIVHILQPSNNCAKLPKHEVS